MDEKIEKIKKTETPPKVIKNIYSKKEIQEFMNLYQKLPITTHNKKQNVIKKRWLQGYDRGLEKIFARGLEKKLEILKWITSKMKMAKIFMVLFKKVTLQ